MSTRLALCICVLWLTCSAAFADADAAKPPVTDAPAPAWSGSVTLYGWLPWIDGDAGVDGLGPVSVHLTPSEILDHLDGVFMLTGDVSRDRYGLYGDLVYFEISNAKATHRRLSAEARLDEAFTAATLAGTYRLHTDKSSEVKALAGLRFWSFDTSISLGATHLGPVTGSDTIQWLDPMIGLKARRDLTENLFVTATGLVGGFGAGAQFSWDVFAGLGYAFNDRVFMTIGYRGLGTDYSDADDLIDLTAHGPVMGIGLRF